MVSTYVLITAVAHFILVHNICLLHHIHVTSSSDLLAPFLKDLIRFCAGVPDPLLGPKGVRLLLLFRGFSG